MLLLAVEGSALGQFGEEGGFFFRFEIRRIRAVEGWDAATDGDGIGLANGLFAVGVAEAFDGVGVLAGGMGAIGGPGVMRDSRLKVVARGSGADVAW